MFTRIVMLIFIAMLAIPVATLTPPAEPNHAPWSEVAVEAKAKKGKKGKKPKRKTVTRTVRQPVTQTFSSTVPFTIGSDGYAETAATPYPGTIAVSGFANGDITDVNLVLTDLTHPYPDDLDFLLSSSDGRRVFVLSDVGSNHPVANLDLTLDDEAATAPPDDAALSSGTFRPAIFGSGSDANEIFPVPAPAHNNIVPLSTFDGTDPNGTWQLWVMDDSSSDTGDLEGWALRITAEVDVKVKERVKVKNKKHKKGKGGKKGKR